MCKVKHDLTKNLSSVAATAAYNLEEDIVINVTFESGSMQGNHVLPM